MKLLIIIFSIIYFPIFSQFNRLEIDNDLEPYVEELVKEAEMRGVNNFRMQLIHEIKLIAFGNIVREFMDSSDNKFSVNTNADKITGLSNIKTRKIFVNYRISSDTLLTKLTVWHEIAHLLKKDFHNLHTCVDCSDIMSEYFPTDIAPYLDKEFLKKRLDDYFCYLKGYGMIYQCSL